jgi:hypothetical protein
VTPVEAIKDAQRQYRWPSNSGVVDSTKYFHGLELYHHLIKRQFDILRQLLTGL